MSFSKISFFKKITLLRVDYNVPVLNNKIQDDSRITASIATIKKIIKDRGKVLLVSHRGRPNSKIENNLSLKILLKVLKQKLSCEIGFLQNHPDSYTYNDIKKSKKKVFLLENIRFYKGELENAVTFAKTLAKLSDVYINDAFSASHRKHASVHAICDLYKEKCFGPLFEKEIKVISSFIKNPKRPVTFVFGGSKLSTKLSVLNNIINYADNIIIGGAMAFPFLKKKNYNLLNSKCETQYVKNASSIIKKCKQKKVNLYLPLDLVFTDNINSPTVINSFLLKKGTFNCDNKNLMAVDIGVITSNCYKNIIQNSSSVMWNGPMGVFENQNFMCGTKQIAVAISKIKKQSKTSLVGGGDTISAIKKIKLQKSFSYVSLSGGALLEFLSHNTLPVLSKI